MLPCEMNGLEISNTSSYIASAYACAVLNIPLAMLTTSVNACLIAALLKSNERGETHLLLILNLAITDLVTGLFTMPSNFVEYLYIAMLKDPCYFADVTIVIKHVIGWVSFHIVAALAVERYIYIFHPYFYNARLTSRSWIWSVVCCIWLLSILAVAPGYLSFHKRLLFASSIIFGTPSSIIIIFSHAKIFVRAQRIRRQIKTEAERFRQVGSSDKDRNILLVGGLIILAFFVCSAPTYITSILKVFDVQSSLFKYTVCWEWLSIMTNSLFNPVISCVFNPIIKRNILSMCRLRRKSRT
eukprot:gene17741-9409_t